MRILIITGGSLPVPAVRGGAIETRVGYLVDENERHGLWNLEVASCQDEDARKQSAGMKHTVFHYFTNDPRAVRRSELWNRVVRKLVKNEAVRAKLFYHPFQHQLLAFLKKRPDLDVVLLENKPEWVPKLRRVTKAALFLHLGNDHLNASTRNAPQIVESLDGILTVSDYITECVMKIPGARRERIRKIRQGSDQALFDLDRYTREERCRIRRRYQIGEADFVFTFAGRIEREKGILELVRAFNRLEEEDVRLLVAGDVSVWNDSRVFYEEVMEAAEQKKEKIIFTGSVAHEQMAEIHAITDTAVLPSTWNEPSGNAMIECMVAGLPLITTKSGGIPEYCPKESAVLVPVTDRLEEELYKEMHRLYQNPAEREKLRNRAKETGKNYTTREHYMQIDQAIRELS